MITILPGHQGTFTIVDEFFEQEAGLEPATTSLENWNSTVELLLHLSLRKYLTTPVGSLHHHSKDSWYSLASLVVVALGA